ncbi:hypothetical protein [Rugosimonospora africana]|nr:hypothetical protein [Rugosimonospora africana]
MTHPGPPERPLRRGRTNSLTWILSVVGIAFGIVFAVAGLALVGFAVAFVAAMNSYGSNK